MEIEIGEIILEEEIEIGGIELDVEKVYPELEDLEVTPSSIEQNFNHPNSYGYDNVKVKAVESDTLNITPTTQSQEHIGLYGTVNVSGVNSSIDSNIKAENIKEGVEILGVQGNVEELNGEEITVKSTSQEQIILPSENKNAFTKVTVQPVISEYTWEGNSYNFSNIKMTPTIQKFTYKETHPSRLYLAFLNSQIADDIYCQFKTTPATYTVGLASQSFRQTTAKRIGFDVSLASVGNMVLMFYGCSNLEEIYGEPFDTSGITSASNMPNFTMCSNFKKITFVNSCINFNIAFENSPLLEDNTLISIANGLNGTSTGQSVKMNATPKARCSTIMGTVNGQGVFEESSSGTTSLEEFITIEKGWSIS